MTDSRSFIIPAVNKSMVEEKLEKLNKRAAKLGLSSIAVTWGKAILNEKEEMLLPCELTGPLSVSYDGWEFIATLQHLPTGENIIRAITDEYEIPLEYRDSGSACEHCNVKRYRKDTYVVRHDATCEAKQVGSTCIKDFLGGNSPDNIMQRASFVGELLSFMEGARGPQGQGHDEGIFHIVSVLAHTSAVIRGYGWISKSEASKNGSLATATIVEYNMRGDNTYTQYAVSDEDKATARAAAEWAENLSDEETEPSDYLYNIRALARSGMVGWRTIGYAASIIAAYNRANNTRPTAESDYVGTIKQRQVFELLVKKITGFSGHYGYTNKYIFQDLNGNIIVWLTSVEQSLKEGQRYFVKGTIKAHKEFRGIRETEISRCEVLKS